MAGAASTITYDDGGDRTGGKGGIRNITIAWTSDSATGAVSAAVGKIVGQLVKGVTVPSGGGTAPTTLYDINITDGNSVDVLAGCKKGLMDRSATVTEEQYFLVLNNDTTALSTGGNPSVCDSLTVAVTNAGNSKQGTIILYYRSS